MRDPRWFVYRSRDWLRVEQTHYLYGLKPQNPSVRLRKKRRG